MAKHVGCSILGLPLISDVGYGPASHIIATYDVCSELLVGLCARLPPVSRF